GSFRDSQLLHERKDDLTKLATLEMDTCVPIGTCEVGMEHATHAPYESFVYMHSRNRLASDSLVGHLVITGCCELIARLPLRSKRPPSTGLRSCGECDIPALCNRRCCALYLVSLQARDRYPRFIKSR